MSVENFDLTEIPATLPLFVLNDSVLFPLMILGIGHTAGPAFDNLLKAAASTGNYVVVAARKHDKPEVPASDLHLTAEDIYPVATIAALARERTGVGAGGGAILKGLKKVRIKSTFFDTNFQVGFAKVEVVEEETYFQESDKLLMRQAAYADGYG